jgi:hypothetical protein
MVAPGSHPDAARKSKCPKSRGISPQEPLGLAESSILSRVGSHGWSLFLQSGLASGLWAAAMPCVCSIDGASPGCHIEPPPRSAAIRSIAGRGAATRLPREGGDREECGSLVFVCGLLAGWINLVPFWRQPRSPRPVRCLLSVAQVMKWGNKGFVHGSEPCRTDVIFPARDPRDGQI